MMEEDSLKMQILKGTAGCCLTLLVYVGFFAIIGAVCGIAARAFNWGYMIF